MDAPRQAPVDHFLVSLPIDVSAPHRDATPSKTHANHPAAQIDKMAAMEQEFEKALSQLAQRPTAPKAKPLRVEKFQKPMPVKKVPKDKCAGSLKASSQRKNSQRSSQHTSTAKAGESKMTSAPRHPPATQQPKRTETKAYPFAKVATKEASNKNSVPATATPQSKTTDLVHADPNAEAADKQFSPPQVADSPTRLPIEVEASLLNKDAEDEHVSDSDYISGPSKSVIDKLQRPTAHAQKQAAGAGNAHQATELATRADKESEHADLEISDHVPAAIAARRVTMPTKPQLKLTVPPTTKSKKRSKKAKRIRKPRGPRGPRRVVKRGPVERPKRNAAAHAIEKMGIAFIGEPETPVKAAEKTNTRSSAQEKAASKHVEKETSTKGDLSHFDEEASDDYLSSINSDTLIANGIQSIIDKELTASKHSNTASNMAARPPKTHVPAPAKPSVGQNSSRPSNARAKPAQQETSDLVTSANTKSTQHRPAGGKLKASLLIDEPVKGGKDITGPPNAQATSKDSSRRNTRSEKVRIEDPETSHSSYSKKTASSKRKLDDAEEASKSKKQRSNSSKAAPEASTKQPEKSVVHFDKSSARADGVQQSQDETRPFDFEDVDFHQAEAQADDGRQETPLRESPEKAMTTPSVQDAVSDRSASKKPNAVDWSLAQTLVNDEVRQSIERSGGQYHGRDPNFNAEKEMSQSLSKTTLQASPRDHDASDQAQRPVQLAKSIEHDAVICQQSGSMSPVDIDAAVLRASQQLQKVQGNVKLHWAQKTPPAMFATNKPPPQTSPSLRVQTRRLENTMAGKENQDPGHIHANFKSRPLAPRSSRLRSTFGKFASKNFSFSDAIAATNPAHWADDDDSSHIYNGGDASASGDIDQLAKLKNFGNIGNRHADLASVSEASMTASEPSEHTFKTSTAKGDNFQAMLISTIQRLVESQSRRERHMERFMQEYMAEGQEILDSFLTDCDKLFHEHDRQNQAAEQDLVKTYKAIIKGTKEFKNRISQRTNRPSSSNRSKTRRTSLFAPRTRDFKAHNFR